MFDLSVVILNWHAAADTIRCLNHILTWQNIRPNIIVVDNASNDDSVTMIKAACPSVQVIANDDNAGFAGGTNVGIKAALNHNQAPVLLLNNDALIDEPHVKQLLTTLHQSPKIGLVGPLLYADCAYTQLLSAGAKNPVLHHQTRFADPDDAPVYEADPSLREVPCISGTAILIRAVIFNDVGLLDEAYFFSTELADLCKRAQDQGYLSLIDTKAKASHAIDRSGHLRGTLYTYYIIRNRFLYIRKFYHHLASGTLTTLWAAYGLALSAKLRLTGQIQTAKAVKLGTADGLGGRFGNRNKVIMDVCKISPRITQSTPPEHAQ